MIVPSTTRLSGVAQPKSGIGGALVDCKSERKVNGRLAKSSYRLYVTAADPDVRLILVEMGKAFRLSQISVVLRRVAFVRPKVENTPVGAPRGMAATVRETGGPNGEADDAPAAVQVYCAEVPSL